MKLAPYKISRKDLEAMADKFVKTPVLTIYEDDDLNRLASMVNVLKSYLEERFQEVGFELEDE